VSISALSCRSWAMFNSTAVTCFGDGIPGSAYHSLCRIISLWISFKCHLPSKSCPESRFSKSLFNILAYSARNSTAISPAAED
jgi:hypothetical protein